MPKKGLTVRPDHISRAKVPVRNAQSESPFKPYKPAPGVCPNGKPPAIAMDEAGDGGQSIIAWAAAALAGQMAEGQHFLGYPVLAELAQRPEYRRISERIASEMTRKWIRVTASGKGDKTDRVAKINAELARLNVKGVFREAAELDGFFGRSHIYIDTGATDEPAELATSIGLGRDETSKGKIATGSFAALKCIEPIWTYPARYESSNPLKGTWYKPESWFVQGKEVHGTRLLTLVQREVPDILKPAYSFGGLSMSQMAKPYVDNWLRVRQGVTDAVLNFSKDVLKTDLANALAADGGEDLFRRIALYTNISDSNGLRILNKETEEFGNVATPLGTLDVLQAQAQEHMAAVAGMPLVVLLGLSPHGLNASSEGETDVWENTINAAQESYFREPLTRVLGFIQLSLFGDVDEEITFEFVKLSAMDEGEAATARKTDAETGKTLIDAGVIDQDEERARITADPASPYHGLAGKAPGPAADAGKADLATKLIGAILEAHAEQLLTDQKALKELRTAGAALGLFTTITDHDITEASDEPPAPEGDLPEPPDPERQLQEEREAARAD